MRFKLFIIIIIIIISYTHQVNSFSCEVNNPPNGYSVQLHCSCIYGCKQYCGWWDNPNIQTNTAVNCCEEENCGSGAECNVGNYENNCKCKICGSYPNCHDYYNFYRDLDGDHFGNINDKKTLCDKPSGYVLNNTDCNDSNNYMYPKNTNSYCNCNDNDGYIKTDEICDDDLDNDCDGNTDEGCSVCGNSILETGEECDDGNTINGDCCGSGCNFENLGETSCGKGECINSTPVCTNGIKNVCTPKKSALEVCDNKDNDCDDYSDNNIAPQIQSCAIANGLGNQSRTCTLGVWSDWNTCTVSSCNSGYQQSENSCIAIPCTGESIQSCTIGVGACLATGSQSRVCNLGVWSDWSSCVATTIEPSIEICNNIDDDCDAETDDGLQNCCTQIGQVIEGCIDDSKCPGTKGKKTCENYEWGLCSAECPILLNQSAILSIGELDSVTLLPEIRKEESICEGQLVKTLDLSNFKEKCQYKTNKMNEYQDTSERLSVTFFIGENTLNVKCGNIMQIIIYNIKPETNCSTSSKISDFKNIINDFVNEGIINEDEKKQAEQTAEIVSETTILSRKENSSLVTHTLTSKENISNMEFRLFIPKECANSAKEIEFYLGNYTVLNDDPLIAWHFTDVKDRIDLSYRLKGEIDQTCLDKIKGLPIAKLIEPNLKNKKPVDIKKIFLPVVLVVLIGALTLYIQRPKKEEKPKEEDLESQLMTKERERLLKEVKEKNLKDKYDVLKYLEQKGMNQETKDWIMKKL